MPDSGGARAAQLAPRAREPWLDEPWGRLLTVAEQRVGRRAVLSVVGEVDISTAAELVAAIDEAAGTSSDIWVDLTETTFMDSTGIHALIDARSRLAQANRRLALVCVDGPVLRVLRIAGVDHSLEIHASRSAAHFAT